MFLLESKMTYILKIIIYKNSEVKYLAQLIYVRSETQVFLVLYYTGSNMSL